MFNRANLLILVVAVLGAAFGLFVSTKLGTRPDQPVPAGVVVANVGDPRVDLNLIDLDGRAQRLSEFDGKLVLLNFWASWCGPCREEMPLLDATHKKLASRGLAVVGVAIDDPGAVAEFLKASPVDYPILISAEDDAAALRFGDRKGVLPYSVLIGRDGKILAQHAGNFSEDNLNRWVDSHL